MTNTGMNTVWAFEPKADRVKALTAVALKKTL